ncbi:MAG: PBSX family phage terminase large subunit [Ruminococcus sp.]|nr:PBSX family phage terminase large subunit [Ruminococcus sp.]
MPFTAMQREYFKKANHRWNVKSGATRSGKTYMDYFLIPKRIRAAAGKDGLTVLLGNTKGTLQRNIIEPLRNIWGGSFVSDIRSDNTAVLFGERCYCLGADKVSQVNRLRGSSIKYCYGDEVVTWHEDVFNMLKSRLDKPYSRFDGTCNPENKNHWFKKFLDSDVDLFHQKYTLDDNPYLSREFSENLKKEYFGTVFYDRYVLGNWVNAEGVIYRAFNDDPKRFVIENLDGIDIAFATVGVDFGGGKSAHAFNCTGFTKGRREIITIHDYRRKDAATPEQLYEDFAQFVTECRMILGNVPLVDVYCDSAEQTLIRGMKTDGEKRDLRLEFHNARKCPINDRIRFYTAMMGTGRYKILKSCTATVDAFSEAMWDGKYPTEDVRLDDGTTNIDNLDAQEYSTEAYMRDIMERMV